MRKETTKSSHQWPQKSPTPPTYPHQLRLKVYLVFILSKNKTKQNRFVFYVQKA